MLCQFTFKNYKSYKEETTIEMQAETTKNEMEDTLIISEKDNNKYLPITAIYGPNAGGKSNALEALVCLITKVSLPIRVIIYKEKMENIEATTYKFSDERNPVEFEIYYQIGKEEFRYNLDLLNDKIIYESLYVLKYNSKKPTKIFIRDEENIELGEELRKAKVNTNNNLDIPFLSFLAISYDIEIIKTASLFFSNITIINCGNDYFESLFFDFVYEEELKKKVIKLFNNLDINIIDYRHDEELRIFMKHKVKDKIYELSLEEESKGTQKLFSLLPVIVRSLSSGNLTIIDEMDAKLHPKLIQYILEMYKDKNINKKGAQLIISSHDLTTMNSEVFRRDEILFAAKNKDNVSELYSLYEIRDTKGELIKTTAAYNKQYIEGRYGADPYLQKILNWEVN